MCKDVSIISGIILTGEILTGSSGENPEPIAIIGEEKFCECTEEECEEVEEL